jgi:hypothetical protein
MGEPEGFSGMGGENGGELGRLFCIGRSDEMRYM